MKRFKKISLIITAMLIVTLVFALSPVSASAASPEGYEYIYGENIYGGESNDESIFDGIGGTIGGGSIFDDIYSCAIIYAEEIKISTDDAKLGEQVYSFTVSTSGSAYSSFKMSIMMPGFVNVTEIVPCESLEWSENGVFESNVYGNNVNVSFSSPYNFSYVDLFTVYFTVNDYSEQSAYLECYDYQFVNENIETIPAVFNIGRISISKYIMMGDVNADMTVNLADLLIIQRSIVNDQFPLTEEQYIAADIDKNGIVDMIDCQYIQNFLVGKIGSLDNIGGGEVEPELPPEECKHERIHEEQELATCDKEGFDRVYCVDCKMVLRDEFIPALGHEWTEEGYCVRCGMMSIDGYTEMTIPEALYTPDGEMVIVTGTVCAVKELWKGTRMSVTIEDDYGNQLYVYGLVNQVSLGEIIRVAGELTTYNGLKQIGAGATAEVLGYGKDYGYLDVSIPQVEKLPDNTNVIVTGTVIIINTPYNEEFDNISVTIADEYGNELFLYRLSGNVTLNSTITVYGVVSPYNGVNQIYGGIFKMLEECEHKWMSATCTSPEMCAICGQINGERLEHVYNESGYCEYCGLVSADAYLSILEANEVASQFGHNIFSENKYYVTGTITEIANTIYGNMYIIDDEGNTLYIYGTWSYDGSFRYDAMPEQPQVGDTVTLYGILGTYNGTNQMKNGWITEVSHGDNGEVDPKPEECWHEKTYDDTWAPTCTTDGYYKEICEICYETINEYMLPAWGHEFFNGYCTRCGEFNGGYVDPEFCKHENNYTDGMGATCTEPGLLRYICWDCGAVYHEVFQPAFGHDFDEYGYCTRCYEYNGGEVDPELPPEECKHEKTDSEECAPTCTEDGYYMEYCAICKEIINAYQIYKLGHNFEDGWCTVCGASDGGYVDPEACTHENILSTGRNATCTEEGYYRNICKLCEAIVSESYIPALGHDFDEYGYCTRCYEFNGDVVEPDVCKHEKTHDKGWSATCTSEGYSIIICVICGETIDEYPLPMINHEFWNGYCTMCGEMEDGYDQPDFCKHEKIDYIEYAPTCTEEGYYKEFCPMCGETFNEYFIEKLPHCIEIDRREANCTEYGYYREFCTMCDETVYEYYMSAWGHNFMDGWCTTCGEQDYGYVEPGFCMHENYYSDGIGGTCTESGLLRDVCWDCGYVLNEVYMPALGHEWTEEGYCARCGEQGWVYPEPDYCVHEIVKEDYAPTCTENGFCMEYCAICKEIISQYPIYAFGHDFDGNGCCTRCGEQGWENSDPDFCTHEAKNAEWIESTCNDSGYYREYCEICGETLYYEDMPMREHMLDENGQCMMCGIVMW